MIGEGKKIKPIRCGPFRIVKKIGTNSFHLDIPSYMHMYSFVNVENPKLYEPPMIADEVENLQVPTIDNFVPKYQDEFRKDVILNKITRTSCQSDVEYL